MDDVDQVLLVTVLMGVLVVVMALVLPTDREECIDRGGEYKYIKTETLLVPVGKIIVPQQVKQYKCVIKGEIK